MEFILCNAPALNSDIITVTVEGVANVDVYHINDCVHVEETEEINVRKEFNQAPNAVIRDNAGFFTHTHREIRFDASRSSDPDGSIEHYQWDFGDGSPTQSGVVVGHTYASAGEYSVKLTVWDNWNRTGKATSSIRIVGLV